MNAENFFDLHARLKSPPAAAKSELPTTAVGADAAGSSTVKPLTVTQVTAMVDKAIKGGVPGNLLVRGELSNVRPQPESGHLYFTLKDANSCLNCVMWRDAASRVKFKLQDGLEMIATGDVRVYAPAGRYQLSVQTLSPVGRGALELALRQLQAKLAAEGLFDVERKKRIPPFPMRIAMVTGQGGAAIQDMLKVLSACPWVKLLHVPVLVQGDGAAPQIAAGLSRFFSERSTLGSFDLILLGRGGGSLEDLWAFNEEIVVRAIVASRIPIITGIGHEIDTSIADLAADYHAHTPTEAARIAIENWRNVAEQLQFSQSRLNRALRQTAVHARQRLTAIERHETFRRPLDRIRTLAQLLDDRQRGLKLALGNRWRTASQRFAGTQGRLPAAAQAWLRVQRTRLAISENRLPNVAAARLKIHAAKLDALAGRLEALSPLGILQRGYTITTSKRTGQILRQAAEVAAGEKLITRFSDGRIESTAADKNQPSLFE